MPQKFHTIFLLILLLILVGLFVILVIPKDAIKFKPIYSDNPKKWIDTKGPVKEINIEKATAGAGEIDVIGLQYDDSESGVVTAFVHSGFYHGVYFDEQFVDEEGKILMKITNDMKPNDGVIEGFVIEKIKDGKPIAYVFLDEDWKKKVGKTYIRYGSSFEHEKIFVFNEASKGIYYDFFEDDATRFADDYTVHIGGIIVGDISQEKIDARDKDVTLIKFE